MENSFIKIIYLDKRNDIFYINLENAQEYDILKRLKNLIKNISIASIIVNLEQKEAISLATLISMLFKKYKIFNIGILIKSKFNINFNYSLLYEFKENVNVFLFSTQSHMEKLIYIIKKFNFFISNFTNESKYKKEKFFQGIGNIYYGIFNLKQNSSDIINDVFKMPLSQPMSLSEVKKVFIHIIASSKLPINKVNEICSLVKSYTSFEIDIIYEVNYDNEMKNSFELIIWTFEN